MTYRILAICTGNICRSPMAEVVLAQKLREAGADVEVDSAATTSYEVGSPIDSRAARTLQSAGYSVPRRAARKMTAEDLEDFDPILPMTREHEEAIHRLGRQNGFAPKPVEDGPVPSYIVGNAQVALLRAFASDAQARGPRDLDVPDPWYGSAKDFEETLATIEDALENILGHVVHAGR